MNIVAIIPARKGSKSIKNKNIINYKGKPLIYHSIKTALKSKLINTVVVSTDSKKYQSMVIKFGASAPFLRPNKYSNDNSSDRDFIIHASKFLISKNNYPDLIVLLRPTTPNRDIKIVNKGIKLFIKNFKKYDSMRSVSKFNQPPQKLFMIKKNTLKGFFDKVLKGEYHSRPRQKYTKTYLPNGYIDILKPSFFLRNKNKLYGKMQPFLTHETIDIDSKSDLRLKK